MGGTLCRNVWRLPVILNHVLWMSSCSMKTLWSLPIKQAIQIISQYVLMNSIFLPHYHKMKHVIIIVIIVKCLDHYQSVLDILLRKLFSSFKNRISVPLWLKLLMLINVMMKLVLKSLIYSFNVLSQVIELQIRQVLLWLHLKRDWLLHLNIFI